MSQATVTLRVQEQDFDQAVELASLTAGKTNVGAAVAFVGYCRDEEGTLNCLELEHFPGMAEKQIGTLCKKASARWPLSGLTVIHRHGKIKPGEQIVLVIATSRHRRAAFEAADFLMDYLKTSAPFWKKEHKKDGSNPSWVVAKAQDDQDTLRWEK
ncbi:molybdenum cofactor biosynthesis protein MoaE [Polycladidibacter hongkongensis]|uniref:molybdenum cofactor biosynthesis protein MoaE n=1 Tax=Polycladidibacter hongkongensis TaxID=1647556 RepID=UPI00082E4E9E|nr:molybdenum cofactor biosynthesis protein MoaE [Pseudovibrio hongkongensis]